MKGRRWAGQVVGLPCTVEMGATGEWIVTVAETTVSRHEDLAEAIVQAAGGLIERKQAEALAISIHGRARSPQPVAPGR